MFFEKLLECARCGLQWVNKTEMLPGKCPACSLVWSPPTEIFIAKFKLDISKPFMFGATDNVWNPRVRRGLDQVHLFERCNHGYICSHICPECKGEFKLSYEK